MKAAVCNAADCGASILWAKTPSGKQAPFDAIPVTDPEDGDVLLIKREQAEFPMALGITNVEREETRKQLLDHGVVLYRSHFATCTNPEDFRSTPL